MKEPKRTRFVFILNGLLFMLSAISLVDEEKWILASIQVFASILNFTSLILTNQQRLKYLNGLAVLAMNVVVCSAVAWDYYLAGKVYLPYLWIFAAILSALALILFYRKRSLEQ